MSEAKQVIRLKSITTSTSGVHEKYGGRLAQLDANGDGVIDKDELLDFLAETVESERKIKYLKYALWFALALVLILSAATAGITYAVVSLTQKVDTQNANGKQLQAGTHLPLILSFLLLASLLHIDTN